LRPYIAYFLIGLSILYGLSKLDLGVHFPKPGPVVPVPVPVVPDSDNVVWAAILSGMADFIEADGKVRKPLFVSLADIEEYRNAVVSVPIRGIGGGQRVAEKLGPKLAAIDSPVLDSQSRAAVVAAFRETAKGL